LPEGGCDPIPNDDFPAMTTWTIFLMLGVSTIWIAMFSAVAYLAARAPARR
jgi:hypothetical protein